MEVPLTKERVAELRSPGQLLIYLATVLVGLLCSLSTPRVVARVQGFADGEEGIGFYDCGTLALVTLLRLEGRETATLLSETTVLLPSASHTMKELKAAAERSRLTLIGVQLTEDKVVDRPMIVFLRSGVHGHYSVMRPVGKSGNLLQIIDLTRGPEILDKKELFSQPEWTGLALVPVRPNWPTRLIALFLITAGLAAPIARSIRRFLRRAAGVADRPGNTTSL